MIVPSGLPWSGRHRRSPQSRHSCGTAGVLSERSASNGSPITSAAPRHPLALDDEDRREGGTTSSTPTSRLGVEAAPPELRQAQAAHSPRSREGCGMGRVPGTRLDLLDQPSPGTLP